MFGSSSSPECDQRRFGRFFIRIHYGRFIRFGLYVSQRWKTGRSLPIGYCSAFVIGQNVGLFFTDFPSVSDFESVSVFDSLLLPLVLRELISLTNIERMPNDASSLAIFGFLYGSLPTAPTVFVFACQYNVAVKQVRLTDYVGRGRGCNGW